MYNSFLSFIIALMLTRNSADARNCYCLASYPSPPPPPPPESQNEPHPFHVKSENGSPLRLILRESQRFTHLLKSTNRHLSEDLLSQGVPDLQNGSQHLLTTLFS